jgi:hypothetical protein
MGLDVQFRISLTDGTQPGQQLVRATDGKAGCQDGPDEPAYGTTLTLIEGVHKFDKVLCLAQTGLCRRFDITAVAGTVAVHTCLADKGPLTLFVTDGSEEFGGWQVERSKIDGGGGTSCDEGIDDLGVSPLGVGNRCELEYNGDSVNEGLCLHGKGRTRRSVGKVTCAGK